MKKWRCTVCGEIVESDVRPDKCPLCKAPGEKFVEVKEEETPVEDHNAETLVYSTDPEVEVEAAIEVEADDAE